MNQELTRTRILGRVAVTALAAGSVAGVASIAETAGAATKHTTSIVVSTTKNAKLGTILVSNGKTLYTLAASKAGCTGACAKAWPELVLPKGVAKATAGTGVKASLLGTVTRSGGVRQVTYNGKALYFFAEDKSSVQTKGNGVKDSGGKWSVYVTVKPSTTKSGGSGSGSGGNTGTGGVAF